MSLASASSYARNVMLRKPSSFVPSASFDATNSCKVHPVRKGGGGACAHGRTFGCVPDQQSMWVTERCQGTFRCSGGTLQCMASRWPMPDGRSFCSCDCPAPFDGGLARPRKQRTTQRTGGFAPGHRLSTARHDGAGCVTRLVYQPSAWEAWWSENVAAIMDSMATWPCGCSHLNSSNASRDLIKWSRAVVAREGREPEAACAPSSPLLAPDSIFSSHRIVRTCSRRARARRGGARAATEAQPPPAATHASATSVAEGAGGAHGDDDDLEEEEEEEEIGRVPLEPLVGFLRHPQFMLHLCRDPKSFNSITTIPSQLLPLWKCELDALAAAPRAGAGAAAAPAAASAVASALADASRPSEAFSARASSSVGRNFLLDAGAGLYATNGLGGGSLRWFWPTYKAQGLTFDRILAWEASAHTAEEVFVPPAARPQAGMPRALADRISYYNLPVAAEPGALANPLRVLRSIATPDDFVVLKLDIDPRQDLEESLIGQILRDDATAALIDELYYEHHVHQSPMVAKGWGQGLMQVSSNQTLADSYAILTRLREKGIRTHSWI